MAQLVVRDLGEDVKVRLRRRAAEHGRSMEAEARDILSEAVAVTHGSVVDALRAVAIGSGGVEDLLVPPRTETQRPVRFG